MKIETWNQHATLNRIQTVLLLSTMFGFSALLGWLLWGQPGIVILIISILLLVLFTPNFSPRLIMRLYRGKQLTAGQIPELQIALQALAQRSGLKTPPDLYYIPSSVINAFAVGRPKRSSIAITDGLIRSLTLREAVNVVAHELSHIRNNDLRVMGIADIFTRLTNTLSLFGLVLLLLNLPLIILGEIGINWFAIVLLIVAPIFCTLAQLGLSRTREYDADLNAVQLTGDPEGLASALIKIDNVQGNWLERFFLPGRRQTAPSLIRSHPLTKNRVRLLLQLKDSEKLSRKPVHNHSPLVPSNFFSGSTPRPARWHISGLWH